MRSTIVLIRSDKGKCFGGYAKGGWKKNGEYYQDDGSFLFSLTHKTKHEQIRNNSATYDLYSNNN